MAGLLAVGAVVVAALALAIPGAWLPGPTNAPALAAEESSTVREARENRSVCAEIAGSDLRSPGEGVWYQNNCLPAPEAMLARATTVCNRTSMPPGEFTEVSLGLYVFRPARTGAAYLWYSSSEGCFDLVSTRTVTAVCADQTVTFSWRANACAAHGGVLALVNGR